MNKYMNSCLNEQYLLVPYAHRKGTSNCVTLSIFVCLHIILQIIRFSAMFILGFFLRSQNLTVKRALTYIVFHFIIFILIFTFKYVRNILIYYIFYPYIQSAFDLHSMFIESNFLRVYAAYRMLLLIKYEYRDDYFKK